MSETFDRAKAHFAGLTRHSENVPEWDCTVWWRPWTLGERQKLYTAVKASGRELEIHPRAIIMKAENANGEKLFAVDNLAQFLVAVDSAVVERLGSRIIATGTFTSPEQAEKN